ncbi:DnaJ domain [Musa troglodytarum]|uniref:DnaJ domain n=1 Tax=Musa troglodytarum TaxID=320322 RepID=A0A9E7HVQ1_9LILI|nr:DnaJ domain [Musa troglodytarum]
MAADMDASGDFYSVLGLKKECSEAELRNAYKKLALVCAESRKWHPDKCSASGNEVRTKEAKQQFQEIQKAYAVLSDSNKRFLYDVGAYDKDDNKDEEVNQLLLWCDSSFPLFLSITPFVAGHGGVSWGVGANDEANQTQCKSLVFELL